MILIIGGSCQGKLDFSKSRFALTDGDIFICRTEEIDLTRRCLAYIDRFTLACVRAGRDPLAFFRDNEAWLADSILIVNDVSGGIVPMDPVMRAWREATGRVSQFLRADEVWRVFCGLPERLK